MATTFARNVLTFQTMKRKQWVRLKKKFQFNHLIIEKGIHGRIIQKDVNSVTIRFSKALNTKSTTWKFETFDLQINAQDVPEWLEKDSTPLPKPRPLHEQGCSGCKCTECTPSPSVGPSEDSESGEESEESEEIPHYPPIESESE